MMVAWATGMGSGWAYKVLDCHDVEQRQGVEATKDKRRRTSI